MKKQDILKKIGIIITELQEQYDYTSENISNLNDLELELFVANANFLTDHLEILRKLNSQEIKLLPEAEPVSAAVHTEPAAQPQPVADWKQEEEKFEFNNVDEDTVSTAHAVEVYNPVNEETEDEPAFANELLLEETTAHTPEETVDEKPYWNYQEPVKPVEEPQPEYQYELPIEKLPAKPEPVYYQPEPVAYQPEPVYQPVYETVVNTYEPGPTKTPIIEDSIEKPLTLNELIAAQNTKQANTNVDAQPIKDLKSAITLNDKLLYVRDLFNGYSMAYSEAIEILNRFSKFSEADQFLKVNYFNKNNWEAKQATTDKFYDLLLRRFPV